jgi:RNA polymerase sigma-70 factor (ECF subfamily)
VSDSDELLMRRVAAGDRAACQALVERHLGRVVTLAFHMLGNRADAEDAAQEVFLRVWTAAASWRGEARFTTWLHRVAANVCLNRLAKTREVLAAALPEPADPRPDPSVLVQDADLRAHVRAALATLPPAQRLAVTLCHCEGLRNIEAAAIMEMSVEALESLLARGRRAMRAQLRPVAAALIGNA